MKIFRLLVFSLLVSLSTTAQDDLCTSVQLMIMDVPDQFNNLKGELEDKDGDTKFYELRVVPEGWAYGSVIVEGKKQHLLLSAGSDKKQADGKLRFNTVSKALGACFSATGKEDKDSFENPTISFVNNGAKITLTLMAMGDEYTTNMKVEKIK